MMKVQPPRRLVNPFAQQPAAPAPKPAKTPGPRRFGALNLGASKPEPVADDAIPGIDDDPSTGKTLAFYNEIPF